MANTNESNKSFRHTVISSAIISAGLGISIYGAAKCLVEYLRFDSQWMVDHVIEKLAKHGIKNAEQAIPYVQRALKEVLPLREAIAGGVLLGAGHCLLGAGHLLLEFYKEYRHPPSPAGIVQLSNYSSHDNANHDLVVRVDGE